MNDSKQIQKLEKRLAGRLVRSDDAGYDEARTVWNGMIDKHPGMIIQCNTAPDSRTAAAISVLRGFKRKVTR